MPDAKISALTEETDIAANDVLPLVDTSAGTTDKVQVGTLLRYTYNAVIATGSLTPKPRQLVTLNLGTAIALTISGSPAIGDTIRVYRIGSGVVTHTVVLGAGIDWDASGNGTASFDTDGDYLEAVAITTTRWLVVQQTGVTFSA